MFEEFKFQPWVQQEPETCPCVDNITFCAQLFTSFIHAGSNFDRGILKELKGYSANIPLCASY